MSDMPFAGKLALVTGASRGIGAATAIALAAKGAHVVLTARNTKDLENIEQQIHEAGGAATIAPLDLTDGEAIGRLAAAIGGRWEALDILVLNAATLGNLGPVPAIDAAEFNKILTLNLLSQHATIAAFDALLRNSETGRLVAITSSVGTKPRAFWGAYGASKAALENIVLAYGDEVKNLSPLKVAIVDPVRTRTAMRAKAYPGEDPTTLKEPAVVGEAICNLLASEFETGLRIEVKE